MKGGKYWLLPLAGVAAATLTAGLLCRAQYGQGGGPVLVQPGQTGPHQQGNFNVGPETDPVFAEKRLQAMVMLKICLRAFKGNSSVELKGGLGRRH